MAAAPSQTADAQAWKRARSRYPLEPDDDGFYVRGRREEDGTWTPVPCVCSKCLEAPLPMVKFATVDEGMDHEWLWMRKSIICTVPNSEQDVH